VTIGAGGVEQQRPGLRAWRDLSKIRLLIGLAFAPVPPFVLGALIMTMLGASLFLTSLWPILAAAEIWSMLGGMIFLLMSRLRGFVRRAHCLLLGAFLAASLPSAAMVTSKAIDRMFSATAGQEQSAEDFEFERNFLGPSDGEVVFYLGLILIPFGTLGGWVFWRVGVRPAPMPAPDVAAVFE